jgi:hypothetical protein
MWLPTRSTNAPPYTYQGWSVKISDPTNRFPSSGFNQDSDSGYESSFEALNSASDSDESQDVFSLDFGRPKSTRGTFNYVEHYKRSTSVNRAVVSYDTDYHNYGIPLALRIWNANIIGLDYSPVGVFGSCFTPWSDKLLYDEGSNGTRVYHSDHGLASIAVQAMLPGIRPGASLINSIYELKDLKTIPRTLSRITSTLEHLESFVGSFTKYFNRRTLKQILNSGADTYLQEKFNVAPMLRDIAAVSFGVDNVKNQLKQLVLEAKKPQRRHWGADIGSFRDEDRTQLAESTGVVIQPQFCNIRRVVKFPSRRFQATIEYSYELQDGSNEELLIRSLADYYGLNLNPQIIWAAIPWSFVVDWVLGVGPWLSQFTQRQLGIVTHISKFGWSVKIDREIELSISPYGQVSSSKEVSYFRTPDTAPLVSWIRSSGVSSTEFTLAAALVSTR